MWFGKNTIKMKQMLECPFCKMYNMDHKQLVYHIYKEHDKDITKYQIIQELVKQLGIIP